MMRITVINPNTSARTATITAAAQAVAVAGVTVTGVDPAVGVLEQVRQHQANTDAFVIACFGDTGVAPAELERP